MARIWRSLFGLSGDDAGPRTPVSLGRQKVDSAFPYHDGSLSLSGDGEGTPDLAHLPLQVVRDDGMDVDDDDPDVPGPNILLVDEVRVQSDKHRILSFGRLEEIAVVEVGPPLVLGRHDLVALGKLRAKPMGNVVVEKYPLGLTQLPDDFHSFK